MTNAEASASIQDLIDAGSHSMNKTPVFWVSTDGSLKRQIAPKSGQFLLAISQKDQGATFRLTGEGYDSVVIGIEIKILWGNNYFVAIFTERDIFKSLFQHNTNSACYFCGKPGPSTAEHVPPSALIEGANCDRITVPSCDAHNSHKSGADRAIATAFVRWIEEIENRKIRPPLKMSLRKIIDVMKPNYAQANREVNMQRFSTQLPSALDFDVPFIRAEVDTFDWVLKMTAAWVWSVTGRHDNGSDWPRAWICSPSFYTPASVTSLDVARNSSRENAYLARAFEQSGAWRTGWQPKPRPIPAELYSFKVCLDMKVRGSEPYAVFRHSFYESYFYLGLIYLTSQIIH